VAQLEFESKTRKQFMTFQLQACVIPGVFSLGLIGSTCTTLPRWEDAGDEIVEECGVAALHGSAQQGLHSSTFSAQRKHLLWDTLRVVSLSVTKTAQVELKRGRV
jgi:hypothetical protein